MSRRLWVSAALAATAATAAVVLIPALTSAEPVKLHHWQQTPVGFTLAGLQHHVLTAGSIAEIDGELDAAKSYGANTIRLQITQQRLVHDDAYLADVRAVTDYGRALGLTMVLNAQTEYSPGAGWGAPHANGQTMRFWRIMTRVYGNTPRVVFDLFNEPRGETWQRWQAGTQPIVDMIRARARNWIWVNGLHWGSTLEGVPLLTGSRIAYTYHHPAAPWSGMVPQAPATWDASFGYLAKSGHPVVDGEFTNGNGGHSRMPHSTLRAYMRYAHRAHIGMLVYGLGQHRTLAAYQRA